MVDLWKDVIGFCPCGCHLRNCVICDKCDDYHGYKFGQKQIDLENFLREELKNVDLKGLLIDEP